MNDRQQPVKVLIVDDHPMMREGLSLRLSLQAGFQVCGEAPTEANALALVEQESPDLVLVDISLKRGNGIDLIKQIKTRHPKIKMLVVTGFDESLYAERALRAGAHGYLNKQESNEKLLEAIETVLAGRLFISAEYSQRLISQSIGLKGQHGSPIDRLTNRELEVFRLIGEGVSSRVIAKRLCISTHTIDTHRENIKAKLGIASASELTRTAVQWVLENS